MKNFIFIFCLLTIISCRKNEVINGFEMDYLTYIDLDAGLSPVFTHNYVLPPIASSYQNFLTLNNYTDEQVISIKPKFMTMDLIDPGFAEYAYLDRAYLFIYAPGLAEIEIGFLEFIRNDVGDRLNFIPNTTEIKDYVSQENFEITLKLQPKLPPQETTTNRLSLVFQAYTTPR